MQIHSQTLQAVNEEYVLRRRQFKKSKLRWRVSYGSRKSLGWIPFILNQLSTSDFFLPKNKPCFYQKIAFINEDFYSYLRQILYHVVMC